MPRPPYDDPIWQPEIIEEYWIYRPSSSDECKVMLVFQGGRPLNASQPNELRFQKPRIRIEMKGGVGVRERLNVRGCRGDRLPWNGYGGGKHFARNAYAGRERDWLIIQATTQSHRYADGQSFLGRQYTFKEDGRGARYWCYCLLEHAYLAGDISQDDPIQTRKFLGADDPGGQRVWVAEGDGLAKGSQLKSSPK